MRTNKPENIINASLLKSIEKLFIPFEASSRLGLEVKPGWSRKNNRANRPTKKPFGQQDKHE
jgi:hypothetical protein